MKVYRASGTPVKMEHNQLYLKGINDVMDAAEIKYGKCDLSNHVEFASFVEQGHRELTKMYPIYQKVEFPSSQKEMLEMIREYGTSVAFCEEDGKLVAYIMDR